MNTETGTKPRMLVVGDIQEEAPTLAQRALADRWSLERLEREYILAVLEAVNHHQMKAADILGIDRRTLYRKLRGYRG